MPSRSKYLPPSMMREARAILGGNGITPDYPMVRHMDNLESLRTYEGTDEMHILILGDAIMLN